MLRVHFSSFSYHFKLMGFEIVKGRPERPVKERRAYISLNKRGEIAMNAEAFRRIGRPANVALLYDPDTRRVGVKWPVAADPYAFPVRRYGRGRKMLIVRAARMLKQFDLQIDRTVICKNAETWQLNGQPMLVFGLEATASMPQQ